MIILESQITSISLDTLHLGYSLPFIPSMDITLDTVHMTFGITISPSTGLIQLEKLTLTITPKAIPTPLPVVVSLSTVSLAFTIRDIEYAEVTGYVLKDLLTNLMNSGKAPTTPARFTDCDQMDLIDAFRAGSAQPTIPYDATDMISNLLHALDLGNPVPFAVPNVGAWCGTQTWPVYNPSYTNLLLTVSSKTKPYPQKMSVDFGVTWTDHPISTISITSSAGTVFNMVYLGNGIILLSTTTPTGSIFRATKCGLEWYIVDISAYTSTYIDCISEYNKTGLCLLSTAYTGSNVKLLRSTTFGASFTEVSLTDTLNVSSISFIDANNVLMGKRTGAAAAISKSLDGGLTWTNKKVFTSAGALPIVIYCDEGYVVCAPGVQYTGDADYRKIYISSDYGETWTTISVSFDTRYVYSLMYLGSGIVLLFCNYGKVYRSTNYGVSWTLVFSDINSDSAISTLDLGSGRILYTRSTSGATNQTLYSSDYGLTWTEAVRVVCNKMIFIPT